MGHNELGDHYYKVGDFASAIKCYSNARDYLTSPAHVVEMCIKLITVEINLIRRQWN
jgi:COP9 signalosome complex subunit 1